MPSKKIADYTAEIKTLEKQISEVNKKQNEIKTSLETETNAINQLHKEQEDLIMKIKAVVFFNFKERKQYKPNLNKIKKNIKEKSLYLEEQKCKADTLSQELKELQDKINVAQEQRQILQKEAEIEDKAYKGDPQAQYEMAKRYTDRNFKEALDWLEKASAQGHQEAIKLKTQIENEKIFFGVCNNTAFDIVEIEIYHNSENTHTWKGRLLSSIDGGMYEPVMCSLKKGNCKPDNFGQINVTVQYIVNVNGNLIPAVKKQDISYDSNSAEKAEKIYLDFKIYN